MEISSVQHQHQHQAMATCPKSEQQPQQKQDDEKKARPQPEQALKCPRCDSSNTKFCYYNNYSLSQPRYFCKGCRRYWTEGGSLRNVPVGGGCRKNHKRSSSSSKKSNDHDLAVPALPLPPLSFDPPDLTLAFANDGFMLSNRNPSSSASTSASGFLDSLSYYGFGGLFSNMYGADASVSTRDAAAAAAGGGLMMFPNFGGGLVNSASTESDMDPSVNNVDIGGENNNNNVGMGMGMGMGMHHHHHQQWPVVDHVDAAAANLRLDPARDYYWNGGGSCTMAWAHQ